MRDCNNFIIVSQQSEEPFPQDFHIGYMVNTPATVEQKYNELLAANYDLSPLKNLKRGKYSSLTFYCKAHGLLIEVTAQTKTD